MRHPIEIQQELIKMPEWERLAEIRQFKLSVEIFQKNANELIQLLDSVKTGPGAIQLWALENRPILDQLLREVARLLHNFVSASFSLIDHARRFHKRNYEGDGRFADYEEQVKERFANDPLCRFVQDLRNFFIHKKVPSVASVMSMHPGQGVDNSVCLEKADLESFEWNRIARQYLDDAPEKIDLLTLVSSYTTKVTDFYNWVFSRLEEIHADDIAAVQAKQNELRRSVGRLARHYLETSITISNQIRTPPEQFFLTFLDHETWSEVCANNPDPIDRANALLDEVEKFSPPLGPVRARVIDLFEKYYREEK